MAYLLLTAMAAWILNSQEEMMPRHQKVATNKCGGVQTRGAGGDRQACGDRFANEHWCDTFQPLW